MDGTSHGRYRSAQKQPEWKHLGSAPTERCQSARMDVYTHTHTHRGGGGGGGGGEREREREREGERKSHTSIQPVKPMRTCQFSR